MLMNKRIWCVIVLAAAIVLALPTGAAAKEHEQMEAKANHFKCYDVLDWGDWRPTKAELKDQFGLSEAAVVKPQYLCNPVDKNGEGVPNPKYHLVCYTVHDDPQGDTPRVKEVTVKNQFYEGPLWVGMSEILCVPSMKSYTPR